MLKKYNLYFFEINNNISNFFLTTSESLRKIIKKLFSGSAGKDLGRFYCS